MIIPDATLTASVHSYPSPQSKSPRLGFQFRHLCNEKKNEKYEKKIGK